jgi:hypothetical protein
MRTILVKLRACRFTLKTEMDTTLEESVLIGIWAG